MNWGFIARSIRKNFTQRAQRLEDHKEGERVFVRYLIVRFKLSFGQKPSSFLCLLRNGVGQCCGYFFVHVSVSTFGLVYVPMPPARYLSRKSPTYSNESLSKLSGVIVL